MGSLSTMDQREQNRSFMCTVPPPSQPPEPLEPVDVSQRKKTDEPLPDEPSDTEDTDSGSRRKKKKKKADEESFVEEDEVSMLIDMVKVCCQLAIYRMMCNSCHSMYSVVAVSYSMWRYSVNIPFHLFHFYEMIRPFYDLLYGEQTIAHLWNTDSMSYGKSILPERLGMHV